MPSPIRTQALIQNALLQAGILGTTGTIYFVSSTTTGATDAIGYGLSPKTPLATLAFALGTLSPVSASKGDIVMVMPSHAETVGAAAGVNFSDIGVTVVGMGDGDARPTFTFATATTATMTMASASCRITNCIFDLTGIDALVEGIVVSAAGCKIDNNLFKLQLGSTTTSPLQAIRTTAAADRLQVIGNHVIASTTTTPTVDATGCFIKIVGGNGIRVQGNDIVGWFALGVGGISNITTATTNYMISDNRIINQTAGSTKTVTMVLTSTGGIFNNGFGIGSGTAPITSAAGWWARNWSAAAVATNGTLV